MIPHSPSSDGLCIFGYIYLSKFKSKKSKFKSWLDKIEIVITEIKINNFKSVADLTLPLGRVNVLIGSNGSGKSNILEAIAFGGAASADKLDNEFLGSRGIRQASAPLMKNAFINVNFSLPIKLKFKNVDKDISFSINSDDSPIRNWVIVEKEKIEFIVDHIFDKLVAQTMLNSDLYKKLDEQQKNNWKATFLEASDILESIESDRSISHIYKTVASAMSRQPDLQAMYDSVSYAKNLADFIIYSPEISSLRKFEEEGQIKPLGIKGEGLFSVLQIFYENYGQDTIDELRRNLHIIEWFDDFEAVFDKVSGRSSLVVKDRHLPDVTLNQHNVNEGFLFLLFYISLMISNETPAFFAIDNIEASFHPILCEELIKVLVELAKKHNKQVILTTHNPFVLDGLDLNDTEQKLFVVERNGDGETIANAVKPIKKGKLSEAWLRGRIGGNPQTI